MWACLQWTLATTSENRQSIKRSGWLYRLYVPLNHMWTALDSNLIHWKIASEVERNSNLNPLEGSEWSGRKARSKVCSDCHTNKFCNAQSHRACMTDSSCVDLISAPWGLLTPCSTEEIKDERQRRQEIFGQFSWACQDITSLTAQMNGKAGTTDLGLSRFRSSCNDNQDIDCCVEHEA